MFIYLCIRLIDIVEVLPAEDRIFLHCNIKILLHEFQDPLVNLGYRTNLNVDYGLTY